MTLFYEPGIDRAAELGEALGEEFRGATSFAELTQFVVTDRNVQLVVLGPGVSLHEALAFTGQQRLIRPTLGVVLLRDQLDVAALAEAIRVGVREVVDAGDANGIRTACIRSLDVSRQFGPSPQTVAPTMPVAAEKVERQGQIVTVFAGKGGCGKSTISTNLAVALAANGSRKVCLIDLDLSFGDIAIMLQLVPDRSMVDAIPMVGRLDETGMRSLLTSYCTGVDTLLAPAGPADGERVNRELVAEILELARAHFDFIVIDTPPFFSDQVLAALDVSDFYILIATPDVPSLKNLRLTLDMFDLLEYAKENRVVVLNRADARVGLTQSDIERVVRTPIQGHVPSTRDVPVSINRGVPIIVEDPGHAVSKAIREIAEVGLGLGPTPPPQVQSHASGGRRRGGFSLRLGR
ncbi:MAG: P-loop NTPase [Dactylosporangium sp.]|nr:P-loop NTPase [Dactylosporangium sp.]NNJ63854.1 P-loop NTPase [Dactylosporangium sp.]